MQRSQFSLSPSFSCNSSRVVCACQVFMLGEEVDNCDVGLGDEAGKYRNLEERG